MLQNSLFSFGFLADWSGEVKDGFPVKLSYVFMFFSFVMDSETKILGMGCSWWGVDGN